MKLIVLKEAFIGGRCQKKAAPRKVSRECKINLKILNMEMRVRNSNKKKNYC